MLCLPLETLLRIQYWRAAWSWPGWCQWRCWFWWIPISSSLLASPGAPQGPSSVLYHLKKRLIHMQCIYWYIMLIQKPINQNFLCVQKAVKEWGNKRFFYSGQTWCSNTLLFFLCVFFLILSITNMIPTINIQLQYCVFSNMIIKHFKIFCMNNPNFIQKCQKSLL